MEPTYTFDEIVLLLFELQSERNRLGKTKDEFLDKYRKRAQELKPGFKDVNQNLLNKLNWKSSINIEDAIKLLNEYTGKNNFILSVKKHLDRHGVISESQASCILATEITKPTTIPVNTQEFKINETRISSEGECPF